MAAGQRYGRLTSVKIVGRGVRGYALWQFVCDCGAVKITYANQVREDKIKSCGCLKRDNSARMGKGNISHGMTNTPEYRSWNKMRDRCLNKNGERYSDYGGRGISICTRWNKFENFLADMGSRQSGRSLDRINNDGDYEPRNCRWATAKQQALNRRNNVSP